jgi:hypothetical protein
LNVSREVLFFPSEGLYAKKAKYTEKTEKEIIIPGSVKKTAEMQFCFEMCATKVHLFGNFFCRCTCTGIQVFTFPVFTLSGSRSILINKSNICSIKTTICLIFRRKSIWKLGLKEQDFPGTWEKE